MDKLCCPVCESEVSLCQCMDGNYKLGRAMDSLLAQVELSPFGELYLIQAMEIMRKLLFLEQLANESVKDW